MLKTLNRITPTFHPGEGLGTSARAGDTIRYTDDRGGIWRDLVVEFAYPRQGRLLARGDFGGFTTTGEARIQSRPVAMGQCVVTRRAGSV